MKSASGPSIVITIHHGIVRTMHDMVIHSDPLRSAKYPAIGDATYLWERFQSDVRMPTKSTDKIVSEQLQQ